MSQAQSELLDSNQVETQTGKLLRRAKERIATEQIKNPSNTNTSTPTATPITSEDIQDGDVYERIIAAKRAKSRVYTNTNDFPSARETLVKYTKAIPKKIVHENITKSASQNFVNKLTIDEQALSCKMAYELLFNVDKETYCKIWTPQKLRDAFDILGKTVGCISRLCYSWGWQIFKGKNISFEESKTIKSCDLQNEFMTPILRHIIMTRTVAGSLQWRLKILMQFINGKYHDAPNHNTVITEYYEGALITAVSLMKDIKQISDLIRDDPEGPCFVTYMNKEEGYDHMTKIINQLKCVVNGLGAHVDRIPLPLTGF